MFRERFFGIFFGITIFTNCTAFGAADDNDRLVTVDDKEFNKTFRDLVTILRRDIGEERFAQLTQEALQNIRDGNFTHFDPLVGDTSCELRALLGVIARQQIDTLNDNTKDLVTLVYILSHALQTIYTEDGFNIHDQGGENNITMLKTDLNLSISNNKLKKIENPLRRAVAYGSVIFAREQANRLNSSDIGRDITDLFRQCLFDNSTNRRPVVSCLGIAHLTLELAKVHRFPILLRLRLAEDAGSHSLGYVLVAYVWDENQRIFVRRNPRDLDDLTQAAVVIDAVTGRTFADYPLSPTGEDIESFLNSLDLEGTILLDSILHPQFAGKVNRNVPLSRKDNRIAQEWEAVRRDVREQNVNQVVRVDHVYVNTVQAILERTQNLPFFDLQTACYFPEFESSDFFSIENIIRLSFITYASMSTLGSGRSL